MGEEKGIKKEGEEEMRQQGETSRKRKPWLLGLEDSGLSVSKHSQV